jgi:hypothetical protein
VCGIYRHHHTEKEIRATHAALIQLHHQAILGCQCASCRAFRSRSRKVLHDHDEVMRKIDRAMAGLPDEPRPTIWDDVPNTEF